MAAVSSRHATASFEIHDDAIEIEESMLEEEQPTEEDDIEMLEQDAEDDGYSDSEESDGAVDPSVQEDMDKFQETFKGIKDRFRLINRIGEGL